MRMPVPLAGADIGRSELSGLLSVLRSKRLALGPMAREFECRVAVHVGTSYAVSVSSGTAGLHLLVRSLGIGRGDEIITTPFSFVASANCAIYEGARPVFADVDPKTLNLDPARVAERVTSRTRAIVGVDVFGRPADWPGLRRVAHAHHLNLIEDSCEALGSSLQGRMCGSFGDAAVFAFYPNKQITTGEGGMVVTSRRDLADSCRSMANQGRRAEAGTWLEHVRLGYNYRLSELQAALGVVQMKRLPGLLARRQRVASWYAAELSHLSGLVLPQAAAGTEVSWFVYVVRLADHYSAKDRERLMRRLERAGVGCARYFVPIHLQPFYRREFGYRRGDFPNAEAAGDRTIALPFWAGMNRRTVRRVAAEIERAEPSLAKA
ncbi:DegT/DnrJ/EryC1/StrS family aminotransferase [candidate division WOR-3 bacterium]|nr:DegT/DnrJ/EryC1/StrS family aminotransferase [candidate division WOR-3 bacterium]